jgi:hypothetical protein
MPLSGPLALQDIVAANGGNRVAGTAGYKRSVDYVARQLRDAGYVVRFEEFDFPFFEERTPAVLLVSKPNGSPGPPPAGVRTLRNSGSGDVSARLSAVDLRRAGRRPTTTRSARRRSRPSGCPEAEREGIG